MEKKSYLSVSIYEQLKDMIINFELFPGERIVVQQLTEKLCCSRTPIRESLKALEQQNLVVATSGNKYMVAPITTKDILDLYQIRKILESTILRSTYEISDDKLNQFVSIFNNMKKSCEQKDLKSFYSMIYLFHREIMRLSNNSFIESFSELIGNHQKRYLYISVGIQFDLNLNEEKQILDALLAKKYNKAADLIEKHLNVNEDIIEKWKSKNPFMTFMVK